MSEEMLKKIEERYKRGEISRETYEELIKEYSESDGEEGAGTEEDSGTERPAGTIDISGRGKVGGMNADSLNISGSGKVEGDVNVREVNISGSASIEGDVRSEIFISSGSCKVEGDISSTKIAVHGSMKCEGDMQGKEIRVHGSARVEGDLHAKIVENSGRLVSEGDIKARKSINSMGTLVAGSIETGSFSGKGTVKVDGLIKAVTFVMDMEDGGTSDVGSIEADKVEIISKTSGGLLSRLTGKKGGMMKAKAIKGREISIQNTSADLVEGDVVNIGPGCRIKVLKAGKATVHESSKVGRRE